jgi:hypothetical protein|tara:strand:- start:69 stop:575 length:507 start_codon:yes stop_codon:yes gene_type:complete
MEKFVKTKLAINGKSDYEEIKSIREKYAHFGMKIAYSVAKRIFKEEFDCEVYVNDIYQVNVQRNEQADYMVREPSMKGKMTYLSIKRLDKKSIHDWRHLQEIKNELCGEDCEAIEIYPVEKRLVDTANQYHLFVFPKGYFIGFGWTKRSVMYKHKEGGFGKVGQRGKD